jgi:hypothetical protein
MSYEVCYPISLSKDQLKGKEHGPFGMGGVVFFFSFAVV